MSDTNRPSPKAAYAALPLFLLALASCELPAIDVPRYALVYGISIYDDAAAEGSSYNLRYADDDARAIGSLLETEGWSIYALAARGRPNGGAAEDAERPDATKARIARDFADLAETLPEGAMVFAYFSGHGFFDGETEYIVPFGEISPILDEDDYSGCISPADLRSWLAALPTDRIVVVIDTCYSGGFVSAGSAKDIAPQNYGEWDDGTTPDPLTTAISNFGELLAANARASGTPQPIVISAAGSRELSYDDRDKAQGAFSYYFLQAPEKADSDGNGLVTATEAYAFCADSLKANWNEEYKHSIDWSTGIFQDFLPHISGGARDLVLFSDFD